MRKTSQAQAIIALNLTNRHLRIRWTSRILSACAFIVVTLATTVAAQTFRGNILGTVTDPNGAVVPEATVTAKNVATDVGIGNPFLGGGGPRNIQFAVRLVF